MRSRLSTIEEEKEPAAKKRNQAQKKKASVAKKNVPVATKKVIGKKPKPVIKVYDESDDEVEPKSVRKYQSDEEVDDDDMVGDLYASDDGTSGCREAFRSMRT